MKYLLDTNTCIRYLNGRSEQIKQNMAAVRQQDIALCSVVKAELFYGAMKSLHPENNLARQRKFTGSFVSLPFDDNSAEVYGQIRAQLEKAGTPNLTLVTHNTREFSRIAILPCEDWES